MPLGVPKKPVYYYEVSSGRETLLYWIPRKELERLVKQKKVSKRILDDYPNGLDIGLGKHQFREFQEFYELDLGIDIHSVWRAFHMLREKSQKPFPKTGFIKKEFLENLGKKITPSLLESEAFRFKKKESIPQIKDDRKRFLKIKQFQNKVRSHFKKFEIEEFDPKVPIKEQFFSKVKMSKGEKPTEFFNKLQQKSSGER